MDTVSELLNRKQIADDWSFVQACWMALCLTDAQGMIYKEWN